ncbi:hypothetical protein GE115_13620 [Agromyces sp. CFH 90414]|uniref:Nuclear transport factor 2 family protein n=1 Tax=Agromyces agglutinans TaxID=2662258 RepID=A0A6I2F5Z8_9MICO|nr:hypothetical protein [Agromyces agglutinans]MRG60895.1 hypothetical protein [Agromyces agglutinans]
MAIDESRIHDFLRRYGGLLAAFDARASAALWGPPRALLTDDFGGALGSDDELVAGLESSYPLYRALGLAGVEFDVLESVALTDRTTRLRVRWHFLDDAGERMSRSDYEYYLQDADGELTARFSFGIDDAEQLADLARRKGVDLPS